MSKSLSIALAGATICILLFGVSSPAWSAQCISEARLNELQSGKWSKYHFHYKGTEHSGKTKYLKDGRVVAVSRGKTYNRGTWKIEKGNVVRYAPDRPGNKRYNLKIQKNCS